MKWDLPPDIKIYEAIGAVADGRVKTDGNGAKVYSSSGNKFYDVEYEPTTQSVMANDNGSYWKGYLGYPAIAFLMAINVLSYDSASGTLMKDIAWKDINTKFKNDFQKTQDFILANIPSNEKEKLFIYVLKIQSEIAKLELNHLGPKKLPPTGY